MSKRRTLLSFVLSAAFALSQATSLANEPNRMKGLLVSFLGMDLTGRTVEEAEKLAAGDADAGAEVARSAGLYKEKRYAAIREKLSGLYPDADTAQKEFGGFIDKFVKASSSNDREFLGQLSSGLGLEKTPADYTALRAAVLSGAMADDVAEAGRFLGDVQTWLRLREEKEKKVPPLAAWINRDEKTVAQSSTPPAASAAPASGGGGDAAPKKKKKKTRSLRDAEVEAGEFVATPDDGAGSLRSFDAARKERRDSAMKDAEAGFAQVSEERRIANEERRIANEEALARRQTVVMEASAAETAAMQAQARELAAPRQEVITKTRNDWRVRIEGMAAGAIGTAGFSMMGPPGERIGKTIAKAVFKFRKKKKDR